MNTTTTILAKHLREAHFGINWTWVNLRDSLKDLTWQQATTQIYGLNSIAMLVFHINYYVEILNNALSTSTLVGSDKFSFACPPIQSQEDWDQLLQTSWNSAERCATLIDQFDETQLAKGRRKK